MGACFLYGSGGSRLEYTIKGGLSRPANPKPGDIWVETDTPVSIASIVSEQVPVPTWDVVEGYVHITAGTVWNEGTFVNFDRRQGYSLFLYPATCVQGIGGKWVRKNAYVYNDAGAWVQFASTWDGTLFYNGNQYTDITGGWASTRGFTSISPNLVTPATVLYCQKAIDLSGWSTLHVTGELYGTQTGSLLNATIAVRAGGQSGTVAASVGVQNINAPREITLDVAALNGAYTITMEAATNGGIGGKIDISKIWLT